MDWKRLLIIGTIISVLLVAGLYLYVQSLISEGAAAPEQPTKLPSYNISITETGVVDYGAEGERSIYLLYSFSSEGISKVELEARLYPSSLPTDVYLLDHPCDECTGKDQFASSLERSLKRNGMIPANSTLTTLKINQLERLTKKGIIIVPTGRIPADMVDTHSDANLKRLTELGCVIIYIGSDFRLSIDRNGVVKEVPQTALGEMDIAYSANPGAGASKPYNLEQSQFSLTGKDVTTIANAIYAKKMNNGYFVVFPDTLDLGWSKSGPTAAGRDVAELIYQSDWMSPIAEGANTVESQENNNSFRDTLFLSPSNENGGNVRLYITTYSFNATEEGKYKEFKREYMDINVTNPVTGRMRHSPIGVNGSTLNFNIEFRENFSEPRDINIFLKAYKDGDQVQEQDLGTVTFITVYERNMRYNVNLSGGNHILRVTDFSGKVYAQSFLHIPEVTISTVESFWDPPSFKFALLSDGVPVPNTKVKFTMDGKYETTVTTDSAGQFSFKPKETPEFGDHKFVFDATGKTMTITLNRPRMTTFFDDPKNQVIIVAIILVAILGVALQRTEPPKYSIDVPDFPPQKKERIPISRYSLVNLIENVNKDYRWKWMPLTTQEIKTNVRKKITYQGKPILISDYNLEKLLSQLVETGEAFNYLGLYGLKAWTGVSGKSPRYLTIFRLLRNFFINNAVLFTDIGQRTDCDILVNYRGENIYVHIYEGEQTITRALLAARKGRNYIVFESAEEMAEFERKLAASATRLSVNLKMEMDNRRIILTHVDALGVLLGRAG